MTKVEVIKGNNKIVMIDGFVPPYEYFMANRKILEKRGPLVWDVLHRYSPKYRLTENRLLLFFDVLIRAYRLNYCQDKYHFHDKKRPSECSEFVFTTKQNWHSIENTVYRNSFTKYLSILEKEFRNQESKGFRNYAQNIIVYDQTCKFQKNCVFGWIGCFNFNIKKHNAYQNYQSFRRIWRKILLE